jgi:hypothetical protein
MKKEYFEITLRINSLFKKFGDEELIVSSFQKLKPKLKEQFIRFELYHESAYYQNLISGLDKEIRVAVANKQYESAARNRSYRDFLKKRMAEATFRFQDYVPPCCLMDNNGLARCFLHSERHQDLITIIRELNCL